MFPRKQTALHLAAIHARAEMLERLLALKLLDDKIHARDQVGNTPLTRATKASSVVCFDLLCNAGADPQNPRSWMILK
eukprot:m.636794 g.636794  ORF g.636794 m.636794 type:complete len:78 (+) comp58312_c0_seq33:690-923(+)